MKRLLVLLALVLLVCRDGFSESGKFEVSALVSPDSSSSGSQGSELDLGPGLAVNYFWTERISGELTLALSEETAIEFHEGVPESQKIDSVALSAAGLYHFRNRSRWLPYAGAGLLANKADLPEGGEAEDRLAILLTAGVKYLLTPSFSLRLDGKVLGITLSGEEEHGEDTRFSAGLGWRF